MPIPPYVHRCTVKSGLMAGNKYSEEATPLNVEYDDICENCGEQIAPIGKIVAHIYEYLLEEHNNATPA